MLAKLAVTSFSYYFGALGDGLNKSSAYPVRVTIPGDDISAWIVINAGCYTYCGLSMRNQGYCWGENYWLQLGNGETSQLGPSQKLIVTPQLVASIDPARPNSTFFRSIAPGCTSSCGVTALGSGVCWGMGEHGEIGNGIAKAGYYANRPTLVANPITGVVPKTDEEGAGIWQSLLPGSYISCGIISNGSG